MSARAPRGRPQPKGEETTPFVRAKRCSRCGTVYRADYKVCPQDGTPLEYHLGGDDDPLIGEVLGGAYCVVSVLGEGGMGRVYTAEHVRLPRRYAVKILASHLARHAEAIGRFEREAQAAARIVHPNVLDVVDVVRATDGRPCIIAELLEGEELGILLDRVGKLGVDESVEICRQASRGLAAAHAAGIVHRDLKPSNLFICKEVDGSPRVKLLDFGVAKMGDGASLTKTGTVVGTPAFMAPEQARGLPDVDGRADVYSLGAVLYSLVTGRPPFDFEDPASILMAVVNDEPVPMRRIDPSIPPMLEQVVMAAMAKDPARRIASAAELDARLGAFTTEMERASLVQSLSQLPPQPTGALSPPDARSDGVRATIVDTRPPAMSAPPASMPMVSPAAGAPTSRALATAPGYDAPAGVTPVTSIVIVAALVGVAVLAAIGALLVIVSSRRDLGESTVLLAALFLSIAVTAGGGILASRMSRKRSG
jgi:serine/threonine-protein kinase